MSQCGGALTAGEVHQNCGMKHRLHSNTEALTLGELFRLVFKLAAGCANPAKAAVERQDVRGEEADVGSRGWRLLADSVLLSVQQVHQAVLQTAQLLTSPHITGARKVACQLQVYLPIVTLQQQQVRGLVK